MPDDERLAAPLGAPTVGAAVPSGGFTSAAMVVAGLSRQRKVAFMSLGF
jgi:hypothetical protein